MVVSARAGGFFIQNVTTLKTVKLERGIEGVWTVLCDRACEDLPSPARFSRHNTSRNLDRG